MNRFTLWKALVLAPLIPFLLGASCNLTTAKITGIQATANPATISSGGTSSLVATVTGTGSFNAGVNWSIISGGGNLSGTTGTSVSYTAPTVTSTATVQIKATAEGDSSMTTTVQITVQASTPPGLSINKFSATPNSLSAPGEVTLEWDVTGATKLELDGVVVTPLDQGSKKVNVTQTSSFILKASNANGSSSKTVDVTVNLGGLQPGVWNQSNWNEATWQ
jgi:hypothetical protein